MKNLLTLLIIGSLLIGCQSPKKESKDSTSKGVSDSTAINDAVINKDSCMNGIYVKFAHGYNNLIIDNQAYILEKNILFTQILEAKEVNEKIEEAYKKLTDQTQASIDTVEKLCSFNGNIEFKQSAVELFNFYQTAWKEYKELVDVKTDKERIKIYEKISKRFNEVHSKTEKVLEEKFAKAHTNFSNEYELHVRATPLKEKLDSLLYPQPQK
ncbi:MAG TPA: hypothetical protein VK766_04845 [Cytophagaceae bacterium]|jgi:hypothetical protein|nr:hypothetical protein [Cytophagaceae bacterium]